MEGYGFSGSESARIANPRQQGGFFRGDPLYVPSSSGQLINHGTVGYYDAIRLSGRYHLKAVEMGKYIKYPGTKAAWKSYRFMKYIYSIPLR